MTFRRNELLPSPLLNIKRLDRKENRHQEIRNSLGRAGKGKTTSTMFKY